MTSYLDNLLKMQSRVEELEAVAEYVPPGILAERLLVVIAEHLKGSDKTVGTENLRKRFQALVLVEKQLLEDFYREPDAEEHARQDQELSVPPVSSSAPPEQEITEGPEESKEPAEAVVDKPEEEPPEEESPEEEPPNDAAPDSAEQRKACRGCAEVKDYSEFQKNAALKDGHSSKCKDCIAGERKKRGRPKKQHRVGSGPPEGGKKFCQLCREDRPVGDFFTDTRTRDGYSLYCNRHESMSSIGAKVRENPKPKTNGSAQRLCAKGADCVVAESPFGRPSVLDDANPGPLCYRCQKRAGIAV